MSEVMLPPQLFSQSPQEMQIEKNFARRLLELVRGFDPVDLHQWAVSGEFDKIFPPLDDETTPVTPTKFKDLKPFEYQDWAKRHNIKG
jgi:hypothetical protein